MNRPHFFYVDVIKVISAIAIILFHFNVHSFYANNSGKLLGSLTYFNVSFGDLWISLFIIVSGATLTLTSRERFNSVTFFKKRFLAIFPSFWVTYLVVAGVFLLLNKTIGDGQYWKIILTIIGLDGFFLYKFSSYYLVGEWYTGYMLLTYLFFPLLYLYGVIRPAITFVLILYLCILLHINYSDVFQISETTNPLMRLPDFFFGMIFTSYLSQRKGIVNVLFIISVCYLFFYKYASNLLPYHFHMIFTGMSLFILFERMVFFLKVEQFNTLSLIFKYLSKYTFLAFLIHHQILLYFYENIPNLPSESLLLKISVFSFVCMLSFLYAILIFPTISFMTEHLKNKLI